MKKYGIFLMCIMVLGMISGACATTPTSQTKQVPRIDGIALVNEKFTISLPERGSTGFIWKFCKSGSNLKLIKDKYVPSKTKRIGAMGKHIFTFKSTKCGLVKLRFKLARHGQYNKPVATKTYNFFIKK